MDIIATVHCRKIAIRDQATRMVQTSNALGMQELYTSLHASPDNEMCRILAAVLRVEPAAQPNAIRSPSGASDIL